jgi:hypothetical protein
MTLVRLAAGLAAALLAASPAAAAPARHFTLVVKTNPPVPVAGGKLVYTGTTTGSWGPGALVMRMRAIVNGFSGTYTHFTPFGTTRGIVGFTVGQPEAEQRVRVVGTGTITGGTTSFAGARGSFTVSGVGEDGGLGLGHSTVRGTLRVPDGR